MKEIEIEWVQPGIKVTAQLTEEHNQDLVSLLWNKLLPYNSLQNHALVSGNHLYHLVPDPDLIYTDADHKVDRTKCPDGTVFMSQLQHIAVKYGPLSEYLLAAPIGSVVPEHVDLLREAGRACWEAAYRTKEIVEVRVTRKGQEVTGFSLPKPAVIGHPDLQKLIDDIHAETERVWTEPPAELVRMHEGIIPSRAGSYDQYFSTLLFVNGEVRPLGYCALNGLVKLTRTTDIPLDTLRTMTPVFIKTPAEFLGYTGLDTLWWFTREVLAALDVVATREQYFALINSLALYVNVLNTWNLHYFPWHKGDDHRYSAA